jgi:hypothetical protein
MFNFFTLNFLQLFLGGLKFTTENIREALLCSLAGMVGIFIVIGIIIISVSLLNKAGSKKDE